MSHIYVPHTAPLKVKRMIAERGQIKGHVTDMPQELTVVIDGVDESQAYVCVVVGHEHNIKELLALGVKLSQLGVHSLQSLRT